MAAELAAGRSGAGRGRRPLPHAARGSRLRRRDSSALLDDLADGALPGVREGIERVERDERWHVGFGLRCLIETQPSRSARRPPGVRAEEAAEAWGDAVPAATRELSARKVAHRLHVAGLIETPRGVAAHAARRARTRAASSASRAPAVRAGGRADAGDVGAGGADDGQVLGAQRAGQRDLQAGAVGVGHERRERVGREPVQEPAAVLDRGVEQADLDARGARHARQQLGRERRVRATRRASA